jgi:hypothetical protein
VRLTMGYERYFLLGEGVFILLSALPVADNAPAPN